MKPNKYEGIPLFGRHHPPTFLESLRENIHFLTYNTRQLVTEFRETYTAHQSSTLKTDYKSYERAVVVLAQMIEARKGPRNGWTHAPLFGGIPDKERLQK